MISPRQVSNRRYPVYWAARGRIRTGAQALVDHRRARVIEIGDADGFLSTLAQRVATLERVSGKTRLVSSFWSTATSGISQTPSTVSSSTRYSRTELNG